MMMYRMSCVECKGRDAAWFIHLWSREIWGSCTFPLLFIVGAYLSSGRRGRSSTQPCCLIKHWSQKRLQSFFCSILQPKKLIPDCFCFSWQRKEIPWFFILKHANPTLSGSHHHETLSARNVWSPSPKSFRMHRPGDFIDFVPVITSFLFNPETMC